MNKLKPQETEPLFWAYGHAVYAAQLLEHGIRLLLSVIDNERMKSGLPEIKLDIDNKKAHKTLGTLFNDALKLEYITEQEKKIIWLAIKDRNVLVHTYWDDKHITATLKPKGREWLINDLLQRKEHCNKADSIITSLINQYLTKYGTSIDALSAPVVEQWQNDVEPPNDILH